MKLLLADDHSLFRDALLQYITRSNPSARVTLAIDFEDAYRKLEASPNQDLVILDLRMPGMNGLEGFSFMRKSFPDIPLALMSGVAEKQDVEKAIELGASGYFPKTLSGKALLRAIEQVVAGQKFIPIDPRNNQIMPAYYQDTVPAKDGANDHVKQVSDINLTPRESQVLKHLLTGASNKEIANALNLQVVTIKLHVRGICRKLSAQNRTQAAIRAKEIGLL